jgi:hypothetical protein
MMLRVRNVKRIRVGTTLFFIFSGVAIASAFACQPPDPGGDAPDKQTASKKDAGRPPPSTPKKRDAGAPPSGPSSSGDVNDAGTPKAPLVTVPNCKGKADIFACLDCCDQALPKMQDVLFDKLNSCICATCAAACSTTRCNPNQGNESEDDDPPQCVECESTVSNRCFMEGVAACKSDPACAAHATCDEACQAAFPPSGSSSSSSSGGGSGGGGGGGGGFNP